MADFFIRRPIVAMVIAILTVIVGAISLKRLPIAEYPPVSPTMIQVTTTYRGAAAEAVMDCKQVRSRVARLSSSKMVRTD